MQSLYEMGVKYTEITTDVFLHLPPGHDFSRVILRITCEDDLYYVNSFNFAYVVLPANLTHFACRIKKPVISEIYLRNSNPFTVMKMFKRSFDLTNVSMIRYVDNFNDSRDTMEKLVKALQEKFIWPVDICPLNQKSAGVSAAISAVFAHADCVTMRYGSKEKFTELQDYLLNLSNLYGITPSKEAVMALCRCHALHYLVFGRPSSSDTDALREYQIVPHRSTPVDGLLSMLYEDRMLKSIRSGGHKDEGLYLSPLVDKLRSMQLDGKSAKELSDIIDSYCAKLFK
ncbi:MAG: hypothetical protein IJ045_07695 [Ruminiclostridium sp.]|nr:hypothetical protein [Ruminiclostridium sp.]